MTNIAWDNGPIFKDGAVGTEQACCCQQCTVDVTQEVGGETSGSISFTYTFPSSPQCVQIVFSMPDCIATVNVGAYFPYVTLFNGSVNDGTTLCLYKPDGAEFVQVDISGILPANCTFTYHVTCNTCECSEFP